MVVFGWMFAGVPCARWLLRWFTSVCVSKSLIISQFLPIIILIKKIGYSYRRLLSKILSLSSSWFVGYSKCWLPNKSVCVFNSLLNIMSDWGDLWSVLSTFTAMLHYMCMWPRCSHLLYPPALTLHRWWITMFINSARNKDLKELIL